MAGVAWRVKLLPVRVIGKCGGSGADLANGIRWAAGLTVTIPGVTVPNNPAANVAKVIYVGAGHRSGYRVPCHAARRNQRCDRVRDRSLSPPPATMVNSASVRPPTATGSSPLPLTQSTVKARSTRMSARIVGAGPTRRSALQVEGPPHSSESLPAHDGVDDPTWDGFYIVSTAPGLTPPGNIKRTGTSLAAAQVAGIAALIRSKGLELPTPREFTPAQIRGALTTSARPHPDGTWCGVGKNRPTQCGIGMVDATRALQAAGPPVVVTAPAAVNVAVGATASFTVEAIGVESYQWTRAGVDIAGATGPSYTTPALAATDNNVAFAVDDDELLRCLDQSGSRANRDQRGSQLAVEGWWRDAALAVATAVGAAAGRARSRRLSRTVVRVACRRQRRPGALAALPRTQPLGIRRRRAARLLEHDFDPAAKEQRRRQPQLSKSDAALL